MRIKPDANGNFNHPSTKQEFSIYSMNYRLYLNKSLNFSEISPPRELRGGKNANYAPCSREAHFLLETII
jgi:hypothetical protein